MACKTYLVEDSSLIRENLVGFLEDVVEAQVVACAASENEAVAWLHTHRDDWELAIVDLFLLQGNGFGVIKACRDRSENQQVIVLTNYATAEMRERSQALGVDAFFDKSSELELLVDWFESRRVQQH
ncbi:MULTISPECIES: response regulator [unclassified Variovorax]|jgi:DNA-binding NarL/FixJ family response regulator|uniref:response regulator n=1 Tax=unclassified Variovorax TaxID=663243 RepID=UPI001BD4A9ED|nr:MULTISPECIES: response regulator [unclassified Variovorax]